MTDAELAAELAGETARLLLDLRRRGVDGPAADNAADALIGDRLTEARPLDALLSEERPDDLARLASRRVWIVDPLDGTREYDEGRDDWAVHVALVVDGRPRAGAVALPALGRLFSSNSVGPPPPSSGSLRLIVSRNRPAPEAPSLARALGAELLEMGSAGVKAMAVVAGEADIYFHSGGQREWDNCAPAAVAIAAGLHASRADGSPLTYNRPCTEIEDLLIARPELAIRALELLSGRG